MQISTMPSECSTDSSSSYDEKREKKSGAHYDSKKSNAILVRPNASPGFWLCCLVPLAFCVSYSKLPTATTTTVNSSTSYIISSHDSYQMLTIGALGMCVESMCFFMYLFVETGLLVKLIISFIPGLFTTLLYSWLMQMSLGLNFFCGFAVTFCYQNAYIRVMRGFPHCFTFGEASIFVQGLMLFLMNCTLQLPSLLLNRAQLDGNEFAQLNAIMMSALFCLLLTCWLLVTCKTLRNVYCFYVLMCLLLLAVTAMPVTKPLPIIKLLQFIFSDQIRIYIILFYLALVGATICAIAWQLRNNTQKASTRMRKIFHVLVVLVFVPGLIYQCTFLYIASGVALALFTVLELFRVLQIPPLANVLKSSFASFSDDKDAGGLALTPFCLLIGIALPLWLSPNACGSNNRDTAAGVNLLCLMSGVLSIGIGDTAASVIGSKYGSLKWKNSSRTLEGTFAFIISIGVVVYVLYLFGFTNMSNSKWLITATAILVTSLVEAHTNQIDNLVLPLIFYIIISFA